MTVGEMIAALSRCDLDAEVVIGEGRPWHRRVASLRVVDRGVYTNDEAGIYFGTAADIRALYGAVRRTQPRAKGKFVFLNSIAF